MYITGVHSQDELRVMFYNVENLFDTKDDPVKDDDDFLPDGLMRWVPWKYWEKLKNITRVITAVGEMQPPFLIGLCEVENDSVIYDLTKRSPLRNQDYNYIITDSPDKRGMDVALLYQSHQFKLLDKAEYEVKFSEKRRRPTRNILHAVGSVITGDTIDIFVCHLPSRSEGIKETETARIESVILLKSKVDSLFLIRENTNILIMGDFNDEPDNKSLEQVLKAAPISITDINTNRLYNMFYNYKDNPEFGSYKYMGKWGVIDNFIVSGNMLSKDNSIYIKDIEAKIYKQDFLLEEDNKYYGYKPYRTNYGPRYNGGFSDHLPIYLDLILKH